MVFDSSVDILTIPFFLSTLSYSYGIIKNNVDFYIKKSFVGEKKSCGQISKNEGIFEPISELGRKKMSVIQCCGCYIF